MAKYRYHVKNYHSIKDADIKIDGITVLAGINGCGKSTLSRWLYYIVNAVNSYEELQRVYFIESIVYKIEKLLRFFRVTPYINNTRESYFKKYQQYIDDLRNLKTDEIAFEDNIINLSTSFSLQAVNDLGGWLRNVSEFYIHRAYSFLLNKESSNGNVDELLNEYSNKFDDFFASGLKTYQIAVSSKTLSALNDVIGQEYRDKDSMPSDIEFFEDKVELYYNGTFSEPLMLHNAIYIDTPMVLSEQVEPNEDSIWGRFRKLMINVNGKVDRKDGNVEISKIINGTIGGKVQLVEDDLGFSKELHYVRNDGLNIRIEDAATGIKSFAYIQRLLDNGWLTKETILLIDEPEAHLHPQWIVEFARLLVLIHKNIGAKIVIASHNPDMVAAIHDMTEYYGILEDTNFYVAKKDEESGKYEYKNLNHEIGEIFESFNIALAKISDFTVEK